MKLSISDIDPAGKRVLMRVDFNVPLDDEGNITDDTRIKAAIPSIEHLTNAGGRVILMSHLGRPKGEKNPTFSLKPAADRLGELISANVKFVDDCVGADAEAAVADLQDGEVLLLEPLRLVPKNMSNAILDDTKWRSGTHASSILDPLLHLLNVVDSST